MTSSPVGYRAADAAPSSSGGMRGSAGDRSNLQHAYLVLRAPASDGTPENPGDEIGRIEFQFNPKELALAKTANWTRHTGQGNRNGGPAQYNGPQPSKLTLEMFFDATDTQDDKVVKAVEKLFNCCVPTPDTHQQRQGSPPWVLFRWGGLTGFLAYISSVSARYTLFTPSGLPIRATCSVTLEELAGEAQRQNPTSGGLKPRRVHAVVEGDTLAGIAYAEYGDPAMWRAIAQANHVDDPLRVRPGASLLLPSKDELPALTARASSTAGCDSGTVRTAAPTPGAALAPVGQVADAR